MIVAVHQSAGEPHDERKKKHFEAYLSILNGKTINDMEKINLSEEEWKAKLTPEQYEVLRRKGTERAFTGKLLNNKENGVYECAGCGNPLFKSNTKFDSGSGWPSFFEPYADSSVELKMDKTFGMVRTEVLCAQCGGHLGHVFHDGPKPTGERYCMNSASLSFTEKDE